MRNTHRHLGWLLVGALFISGCQNFDWGKKDDGVILPTHESAVPPPADEITTAPATGILPPAPGVAGVSPAPPSPLPGGPLETTIAVPDRTAPAAAPVPGVAGVSPALPATAPAPTTAPAAPASWMDERPQPLVPMPPVTPANTAAASAVTPSSAPAPARVTTASGPFKLIGDEQVVEASMLQINDKFITLQQVLHPLRDQLKSLAIGIGEPAFRQRAAEMIQREIMTQVERTLLSAEAEGRMEDDAKAKLDDEVRKRVKLAIAEAGGSKSLLVEQLRNESIDFDTWQAELRRDMMMHWYIQDKINPQVDVSREAMLEYFRDNRDRFRTADHLQMQVISSPTLAFVPAGTRPDAQVLREAREKARQHINDAAIALNAGQDYTDAAKKYDRGPMAEQAGVWPMMEKGSFRAAEVEKAALALKPGRISDVVVTPQGYYIVKLLALERGKDQSFEAVQGQLENELRQVQRQKFMEQYMRNLHAKTRVVASDRFVQTAVDAAVKLYK